MTILRAKKTWRRASTGDAPRPWRALRLTHEERTNARAVLVRLRPMYGTWARFATALGVSYAALRSAKKRGRGPGIALVLRVARVAGLTVEDVIAGRRIAPGACPMCGR